MPMFDDPKKELQWLQEQLLAQEEEDVSTEDWLREDREPDFDEELDDILRMIGEEERSEAPLRNYANNYGRAPRAEAEEGEALYAEEAVPPKKKKKREKGIRGLIFLAIVETLGILAIAAWWVKFLWL